MNGLRAVGWGAFGTVTTAGAAGVLMLAVLPGRVHHGPLPFDEATVEAVGDGPRLVVTSLRTSGPAAHAGLRVGDAIETVEGHGVSTLAALRRAVRAHAGAPDLHLGIRRGSDAIAVDLLGGAGEETPGGGDGEQDPAG